MSYVSDWNLSPYRSCRRTHEYAIWTLGGVLILLMATALRGEMQKADKSPVMKVQKFDAKEERIIIKSLPFTLKATPGADLYIWQYPDTVTAQNDENVLTVTNAPRGNVNIHVRSVTARVDGKGRFKGFITKVSVAKLFIDISPPPGPDPPPNPDPSDDFEKSILAAYEKDGKPKDVAAKLAELYRSFAGRVSGDGSLSTVGVLHAEMKAEAGKFLQGQEMLNTRTVIAAELDKKIPTSPALVLTGEYRGLISASFTMVAKVLEKCK